MGSSALAVASPALARRLSRTELARRILTLPPEERALATHYLARAAASALERKGARSQATRTARARRRYAGDPWAYFADILGWTLTPQQEEALAVMEAETRVLLPSGNNLGKTFLIGGFGVYVMDAVAALPDAENGAEEQGARILLPGPDHDTVFETVYAEMLSHAARAEARGHLMPGERSDRSVLWRVRAKWHVEVLTPPKRVGQNVAHTASGRHHRNQIALIEEGQGVEEPLWRAAEGMCSSPGNKIISPFNPTEPSGPAYARAQSGGYRVVHLDAFEHPNVKERRAVVPDAVDVAVIDQRVRTDCRDRGPWPGTPLEPDYGDFVYALPPARGAAGSAAGAAELGPRADGQLGAPGGALRVYRPNGPFTAQVRGRWPASSDSGLFNSADLDAAMRAWREAKRPPGAPDRVGGDIAREGTDDTVTAPAWGDAADVLLRAYAEAQEQEAAPAALAQLLAARRAYVGELRVFPKGDGPETAQRIARVYPDSPLVLDEGGVGSSPLDHLTRVLGQEAIGVSFGAAALPRVPGEPWTDNLRTQLYVRAAMVVARGLVLVPHDPLLREELLAHWLEESSRTAEVLVTRKGQPARRVKQRVPSVALPEKKEIKKRIGRSPDRADAFVLSLFSPPTPKPKRPLPLSTSYFHPR